ncbi:MAG: cell division protein ZapA [Burkholderiales bacterium]|nr:cell division protein ZapA [Burkholderiales bacterium]
MGKSLDVEIMGRQYRVACDEGEENLLLQAVAYLDRKMLEIRDAGKLAGTDRIAVMAALNMAHELLTIRSGGLEFGEYRRRIEAMSDALASVTEQR